MIMPRVYKTKPGSRSYPSSYTADRLDKALCMVASGKMSILKASKKFSISYGTLYNKSHALHMKKVGGQYRLSDNAERTLVNTINHLANWKVPMDSFDVRLLVKGYLDKQGVHDRRFVNNFPAIDWLKGFMQRHGLTSRLADNVKPARAEVDSASVNKYYDELTMADVAPENVYNYDETNVCDDPGVKTIICRRGLKRVERKMQHSKSSVSLMFCGNALGEYLPPMVVYRAQNIYTEWTRGGPTGCIYECTKSGWFDSRCFERWFREIFLPHANAKDGKKVLLGDNLASHFTPEVIQAAVDNNIEFVCLIPNSTHILQPLDVAVFRSVKVEWRRIMEAWRKEARIKGSIPKSQFPGLLRKLESRLKSENLIAGFRATGIWPLDRDEVLKRLPGTNQDIGGTAVYEVFNDAVIDILQKHCGPSTSGVSRARGKKIQVTPGRRITPAQLKGSSSHNATTTGTGADGSDGAGTVAVTDARN